ncbi:MAG: ABC transporter permease subunit [Candidatus Lokiarchaeota archaeon]|nr:ABC transporter permease subunit [Candidatus Lokiarchaeota archaeon]
MASVFTKPSRRITNMIAKELRLIVKDKVALFLIFLLPAALIGMLYFTTQESGMGGIDMGGGGFGGGAGDVEDIDPENPDVENVTEDSDSDVKLGIIDLDTTNTYEGEDLSENFTETLRNFVKELIPYNSTEEAFQDLYEQEILGYVVIPDGFEKNLTNNEPTYVNVHVDATAMLDQSSVLGVVQGASITFRASKLWIRSEVFPSMVIEFTPDGGYVESMFGGFIVVFSSYLGIAMTSAQSIVGDTPLRRMLLTPTNRLEVIVAKVLAYVVIGFFQSLLLISLWIIVFGLQLNTGFESLVIIMSLTSLTGSTTGILISAVAGSRLQANQMFLFVLFATIILSGFFIDVGVLDQILPMNQGLGLLIDTGFKGLTLIDAWSRILRLLAFSVFAILASTFIFSKKPTLG